MEDVCKLPTGDEKKMRFLMAIFRKERKSFDEGQKKDISPRDEV